MTTEAAMPTQPHTRKRKGQDVRAAILEHACQVLIDSGYSGFSALKVAKSLGISQSHLTHHYPTREELLHALVDHLLESYTKLFDEVASDRIETGAEGDLAKFLDWLLDDAVSYTTARLFPALWELANQDDHVAAELDRFYTGARIAALRALGLDPEHPATEDVQAIMTLLGTVVEGSTALFGRAGAESAAFQTFKHTAKTVLLPKLDEVVRAARVAIEAECVEEPYVPKSDSPSL